MLVLRIGGELFIAAAWPEDPDDVTMRSSKSCPLVKTEPEFDHALFELCWQIRDCQEAVEMFTVFHECPVCLARHGDSTHIRHKEPWLLLN